MSHRRGSNHHWWKGDSVSPQGRTHASEARISDCARLRTLLRRSPERSDTIAMAIPQTTRHGMSWRCVAVITC